MTNRVGNVTDKKWCGSVFPCHQNGKIIFAALFVALFLLTGIAGAYSGGDGSKDNPYQISSGDDLRTLSTDSGNWNENFILTKNIYLPGGGSPPSPIANLDAPFTGSFDGQGYTISNFVMNKPGVDYVGLFGCLGTTGKITDLGIEAGDSGVSGKSSVGVLVGYNMLGTITNCYTTGTATATGNYAGGLAGASSGTLKNCYATGSATAEYIAGGLVGWNLCGTVKNCYATGNATAEGSSGGLVGRNEGGSLTNCYATGTGIVRSQGDHAGGLVGVSAEPDSIITNCYRYTVGENDFGIRISDITKFRDYDFITGFERNAGLRWSDDIISTSVDLSKIWFVSPSKAEYPTFQLQRVHLYSGGSGNMDNPYQISNGADLRVLSTDSGNWGKKFIVTNDIILADGSSPLSAIGNRSIPFTGSFDGQGHTISNFVMNKPRVDYVGLFGYLDTGGEITRLGIEAGESGVSGMSDVGVLVGLNSGSVTNCYVMGNVTAALEAGGLVGWNAGSVTNCSAAGSVTADLDVGGLAGNNFFGSITNCSATGSATADAYSGGLVGYITDGSVTNCFATGSATAGRNAGGLVGTNNAGTLTNCYATGSATADNNYAGGLVGDNFGSVTNCYATGSAIAGGDYAGGLAGSNNGYCTVTNCYATGSATTGGDYAGGLVGDNHDSGILTNCYRCTVGENDFGIRISDMTKFRNYDFITGSEMNDGLGWSPDIISTDADSSKLWRVFTYRCHGPLFQWQSAGSVTLTVNSAPEGAAVSLNGVNTTAVTNHTFNKLPAGVYNITVERAGHTFAPEYLVVHLADGETKEVPFSLTHETGGLQINSTPSGADIYLDGILNASVTNATLTGLDTGTYNVTVVLDDYKTAVNDTVTVTSGATTLVFFDLVPEADDPLIDPTPYYHVSDGDDNPAPYVAPTPTPTPVPTNITPAPESPATPAPGTLVPEPAVLTGTTELPVGPDGEVESRVTLRADDMSGYLTIGAGVVARDASGNPVGAVSIAVVPVETIPSSGVIGAIEHPRMLCVYNCTPEGATFSPAISLTFILSEEEWNRYGTGVEVGWFNSTAGEWEVIAGVADADQRTMTIPVSHFSTYALFADDVPEVPVPEMTGAPAGESGSSSLWLWGGLFIVTGVVAGGIYFMRKRQDK